MVKYITLYLHYNHLKKRNKGIMTNYKIKDHLGETVKTVQVKSIEELNDIIYEYLVILFNKWIDNGIIEEEVINGIVILLYKKG